MNSDVRCHPEGYHSLNHSKELEIDYKGELGGIYVLKDYHGREIGHTSGEVLRTLVARSKFQFDASLGAWFSIHGGMEAASC
jgi:hypothetical protein